MDYSIRIIKACAVAAIMFLSIAYVGFPLSAAVALSLVPLVLGVLSIFTSFAYSLTAIVFTVACASAVVPDWRGRASGLVDAVAHQPVGSTRDDDSKRLTEKNEKASHGKPDVSIRKN